MSTRPMSTTPISPKVSGPVLAGIFVSSILSQVSLITPDMLSWFGPWSPFIYGTGVALLGGLVGYWMPDRLRELGAAHAAANTPLPAELPAPVGSPALDALAAGRHAAQIDPAGQGPIPPAVG